MFTGIVEESGIVRHIQKNPRGIRLTVHARVCVRGIRPGDSLAVNGCCLTVVRVAPARGGKQLGFDLLQETWDKTNLSAVRVGSRVNLERPLRADGRLDGHFVTGHVDGQGAIERWERSGADWVLDLKLPPEVMRYMVYKGSIAVDGISLTIAKVLPRGCRIWIIPHTYEVTALCERRAGDRVNLEADLLGKYVDRFFAQMVKTPRKTRK
ncbi:MAG: riboflavin synthase [Verrucomicrobia bacterium]|nr:riboflavin synthase [Verrucomicrobiota bacterium]